MFYALLVTTALSLHFTDRARESKAIFFIYSSLILFIIAVRGNGTGASDYDAYKNIYSRITEWYDVLNPTTHVEIGFRFLSYIGNVFDFDSQYIIIAMAILSFAPVAIIINRYSPYRVLSLLVWFPYIMSMNMQSSRMSVAAAFGLIFFISFYQKKRVLSLLSFLLGVLFHSSFLLLIFVFFARFKVAILVSLYFILLFFSIFLDFSVLVANLISTLGLDGISTKFISYIKSEDYGYPMKVYDPRIIISSFIVALVYLIKDRVYNKFHIYLFKLFLLGSIFFILFSDVTILAWRVGYIFSIVSILVVPLLLSYLLNNLEKSQRLACLALPAIYFSLSFMMALTAQPYILFWQGL